MIIISTLIIPFWIVILKTETGKRSLIFLSDLIGLAVVSGIIVVSMIAAILTITSRW